MILDIKIHRAWILYLDFMSRIIYKRIDAKQKLFRKFEKEIKVCTKLSADIEFLLLLSLLKKD